MPPKQSFTKEMILQAAEKIMREKGFENVNARSLAKELGSSTQPIYSQFATMEELKAALYEAVTREYMNSINAKQADEGFLSFAIGVFISTAKNDSNLFRFIYNSNNFDEMSLDDLLAEYKTNRIICEKLTIAYSLPEKQGRELFFRIWFFVYGVSTMLASNKLNISDDDVFKLVRETVGGMIRESQRASENEK